MRSFAEIRKQAEKGDYHRVAEIVGCSYELVKKVINEKANDRRSIRAAFDKYLEQRIELKKEFGPKNS